MPRFAKNGETIESLKELIDFNGGIYEVVEKVCKDLIKIEVDLENADLVGEFDMPGTESLQPYEMLGSYPVAWCACGGDWQKPLVFVVYVGDDKRLRAYIPSKGNAFDHKNKCAYDGSFTGEYKFDVDMLREDVKHRIQVKDEGLYTKEELDSWEGYVYSSEEEDSDEWYSATQVFSKFISYVWKNYKLPHRLEETESCEFYDEAYTFADTDNEMYLIFSVGDTEESDGLKPYLLIHNKDMKAIVDKDFEDMREYAEYLNANKEELAKTILEVSRSFDE